MLPQNPFSTLTNDKNMWNAAVDSSLDFHPWQALLSAKSCAILLQNVHICGSSSALILWVFQKPHTVSAMFARSQVFFLLNDSTTAFIFGFSFSSCQRTGPKINLVLDFGDSCVPLDFGNRFWKCVLSWEDFWFYKLQVNNFMFLHCIVVHPFSS